MIVGNGDVASTLKKLPQDIQDKFLFFASGVSNSQETRESEYSREENLLLSQDRNSHIIYFSSLSVFYNSSRYAKHKLKMERLVKTNFKKYTVVRLGNITWGKNPYTFLNYFKNAKKEGKEVQVFDDYRYLLEEIEFLHWMSQIPDWNCEMNVTGKFMKVKEAIEKYVD